MNTDQPLSRARRRELSELLGKIPASCPADLHDWTERGHHRSYDPEFGDPVTSPIPNVVGAIGCHAESTELALRGCWCGKLSKPRALTTAQPPE
ncbi:hypothetical protein ACW2Q0_30090 [Nocardia sp. R16R-3T]